MKTLALAIALLVLATVATPAATLATARTRADNWLAATWPTVTNAQNAYLVTHGRYWQGLLSSGTTNAIPNHTTAQFNDAVQAALASHPHYQAESIADVFPALAGAAIPAAFECTQYASPRGPGYVVTVYVRFNGVVYTRSQNFGPESWRTLAWAVLLPHNTQ